MLNRTEPGDDEGRRKELMVMIYRELLEMELEAVADSSDTSMYYSLLFADLLELSRLECQGEYCEYLLSASNYFDNWPLRAEICIITYSSWDFETLSLELVGHCDDIFNQAVLRLCLSGFIERVILKSKQSVHQKIRLLCDNSYAMKDARMRVKLIEAHGRLERIEAHVKGLYNRVLVDVSEVEKAYRSYPPTRADSDSLISSSSFWKATKPLRVAVDIAKRAYGRT
jgi:hypothetical protein